MAHSGTRQEGRLAAQAPQRSAALGGSWRFRGKTIYRGQQVEGLNNMNMIKLNGTWRAAAGDLLKCAVGHVGWFMQDVWTREMVGDPNVLSEATGVLKRLFGDF
ncbi:hypothetical protein TRAPUB_10406 [Trametes pubescens]|uniref:Uncharacterized protein n=1 Tax=Trametes pubescens TaxID=154538 RepID=A0A1M2VZN9_TRAPU|nr:hypothetical protein TRAPUB_10406 [Trametes pubescens]